VRDRVAGHCGRRFPRRLSSIGLHARSLRRLSASVTIAIPAGHRDGPVDG
jgi:hypothetical protein